MRFYPRPLNGSKIVAQRVQHDVSHVSGNERQTMHFGRCGEKSVDDRQWVRLAWASATLAIKGAGFPPNFIDKNLLPRRLSRKKSKKRPTLMRFAAYARDGKRHVGMVEGARILPAAPLCGRAAQFAPNHRSPGRSDRCESASTPPTSLLGLELRRLREKVAMRLRNRRLRSVRGATGQGKQNARNRCEYDHSRSPRRLARRADRLECDTCSNAWSRMSMTMRARWS